MRFVDLFAGLGGFHLALEKLGHRCVFASELNPALQDLYLKNFGIKPAGDIRKVKTDEIPQHDILCAGFPCQPFSKAGEQQGIDCPKWGDLFEEVLRILRYHKPSYLILENVQNLAYHKKGATWVRMEKQLRELGYYVEDKKLSPHEFGIPQIRERIFIVGSLTSLEDFNWPEKKTKETLSIENVLDKSPKDARKLPAQVIRCLDTWQEFLDLFPADFPFPKPLWSMEFGATYPYKKTTPRIAGLKNIKKHRGSHGQPLAALRSHQIKYALPSYATNSRKLFPLWKLSFIEHNRKFYLSNKTKIDKWLPKILEFPPSLQKLEWNCTGEKRDIWKYVIQFRASGVRVKRRTTSPTLVAMTTTQVPIIAWERRYMTPQECARLQSMDGLKYLPQAQTPAFEALGNAVNVKLVQMIAKALVGKERFLPRQHSTTPEAGYTAARLSA